MLTPLEAWAFVVSAMSAEEWLPQSVLHVYEGAHALFSKKGIVLCHKRILFFWKKNTFLFYEII